MAAALRVENEPGKQGASTHRMNTGRIDTSYDVGYPTWDSSSSEESQSNGWRLPAVKQTRGMYDSQERILVLDFGTESLKTLIFLSWLGSGARHAVLVRS